MFKPESYITPIILSHVERYVKNVRKEQSQVSLWGGDVSFSDLDLRLDVLERELRLPFSFVSGHVHGLHIHVPWTRLNAEPIVVTINTIECVLKLPGEGDPESEDTATDASLSVRLPDAPAQPRQPGGDDAAAAAAAPPGYVQSMINRIISNVSIVCNNLILKYVEDDIVLSVNVRNLHLSSADELWEPAFTEPRSLPHLVLRKLVRVTDLTVCLDRRNASGKIEHYQEPLLYRCSLDVHAAWCYDAPHAKVPSVTRYEVRCRRLDFSLTDTQVPMFLRIASLALALYYGQISRKGRRRGKGLAGDGAREGAGTGEDGDEKDSEGERSSQHESSWSGWAWNMGSSVGSALLPIYWEDDDAGEYEAGAASAKVDVKRDMVFHSGVFVDFASLTLKRTQLLSDRSLFGSTRQCFAPFLRVECGGIFQEVVVRGMAMANVRAGVSELRVLPAGVCPCGVEEVGPAAGERQQQQQHEEEARHGSAYVSSGKANQRGYLRDSLFEKSFGGEEGEAGGGARPVERRRSYAVDWDGHLEEASEERMLLRTPAFALDYLYVLDVPEDLSSEQLSEVGCDMVRNDSQNVFPIFPM